MSSGDPRDTNASSVWVAVEKAELPKKKYFKIGEVASLVGVEPHVLRYWQTQFPRVRPQKSRSGHRLYRRKDVELLLAIKELLHVQRFTIAGARQALKSLSANSDERSTPPRPAEAQRAVRQTEQVPLSLGDEEGPQAEIELVGLEKQQLNGVMEAELARGTPGGVVSIDVVEGVESTPPEGSVQVEIGVEEDYSWTQVDLTSKPPSAASPQDDDRVEDSVDLSVVPTDAALLSNVVLDDANSKSVSTLTDGQEKAAQQLELSPAPKAGSALGPDSTTEQRSQRQLGFGFIPTNKELLLKAKRDLVSLLNFLDDEDQKSRRRRTSSS